MSRHPPMKKSGNETVCTVGSHFYSFFGKKVSPTTPLSIPHAQAIQTQEKHPTSTRCQDYSDDYFLLLLIFIF